MKTEKKNLCRISIVVTTQTNGNLEQLAARRPQRWCNNRQIFRGEPDFRKYDPKGGQHG